MKGIRILYVDDDVNRLSFAALLEDAGFQVEECASLADGKNALESGRQWRIVLLEPRLADALVPLARKNVPGAKIVMLSGSAMADNLTANADAALVKGGNAQAAIDALKQLSEGRRRD